MAQHLNHFIAHHTSLLYKEYRKTKAQLKEAEKNVEAVENKLKKQIEVLVSAVETLSVI